MVKDIKNRKFAFLFLIPIFSGIFMVGCDNGKAIDSYFVEDFVDTCLFTSGIEGPAFDLAGNLYVVNFSKQGTIGKIDRNGKAELFIELPDSSIGNGIRFLNDSIMYVADYKKHNILKINIKSKNIEIFAHNMFMNQPNDIAIGPTGTIFASDPSWADSTGKLWRIEPDGKTVCLDSEMGTTNGIEVNNEGTKLYVNESIQRNIWVYDLSPEGNISNKKLFFKFADFGLDGMRVDKSGRLFVTRYGKGSVAIFAKDGSFEREVFIKGKKPSNLAFGGENNSYCYVTEVERRCVEKFKIE